MKTISFFDDRLINCLPRAELTYVTAQHWERHDRFNGYHAKPRSTSAFVLLAADVELEYTRPDGEKFTVSRGDIVYAPTGCSYDVLVKSKPPEPKIRSYVVSFNLYDEDGEILRFAEKVAPVARRVTDTRPFLAARDIYSVFSSDENYNVFRLTTRLYDVLDAVFTVIRSSPDTCYPIRAGVEALEKEWMYGYPISRYAALCGISTNYFQILFRRYYSASPVEHRNFLRIAAARRLLITTSRSISDISAEVGCEDPFYFSRLFKKETGVSPLDYRRMNK